MTLISQQKNKIIKGGFFLSISNVFAQITSVIVNIFLARILIPNDFGVFALANASIGFISVITSVGFGSAIINNQNTTQTQISTLYWLNFITGSITLLLVFFIAPVYERFYESNGLADIIRFSGISIIITPFFITHLKILERDLEFKKISFILIASSFLSSTFSIISAYSGFGIYSLVVQAISMNIIKLVLTLYYCKWKQSFIFKINDCKHMIWFALKYRTSQAVQFFERNIDYLILGKLINSLVLGYYSFAFNIMYMPVKRIADIFRDILFPSFSKLKNEPEKLIIGYLKSLRLIMMVSFPLMLIISFNCKIIILTIFGEKWIEATQIISILSIGGAFQSITQFGDIIFTSLGSPEKTIYISLSRILGTIFSILIGIQFGIIGVSYFLTISKILSFLFILYLLHKQISLKFNSLFEQIKGNLLSISLLIVLELLFRYVFPNLLNTWLKTLLSSGFIAILMFITNLKLINEIKSTLKTKI